MRISVFYNQQRSMYVQLHDSQQGHILGILLDMRLTSKLYLPNFSSTKYP